MLYALRPWRKQSTALYVGKIALLVAFVALSGCAFAANGIMLQIKDAPLKEVVMLLTQQSGTNIVIADESKLDRRVTASLTDVPLEKALDYIVKSAGVSYKRMDDGTYIIGGDMPDDVAVVPILPALPSVEPDIAPKPSVKTWTSIKLTHSRPSELLRLLGWEGGNPMPNCETVYPDSLNRPRGTNITTTPGGTTVLGGQSGDTMKVGSGAQTPNSQPVAPTIDPRATSSDAGRTADSNYEAAQVPGPPGYPRPNTTPNPNNPTRPNNTGTGNNQNFLWPDGVDNAVPFDVDNSIIVKGDEQGIQDFKNIIRMLDVPPKQVSIKAEFVEVNTTDAKAFGIDWSLDRLNESFSAPMSGAGNVRVGFATGNLTAILRTQLTQHIGRVINSPIISTINNQNAYISINKQIPYWTSYNTVTGTGTVIQQSQPNFITIDTRLNVLPRVNGDGTITMTLSPSVSGTGDSVTGPDGTTIPVQDSKELFTQRRVANGETIVIGGFIQKNDSHDVSKIPILGDLPIVGSLFRGTSRTVADVETLIFITATIIPDSNTGSISVGGNLTP